MAASPITIKLRCTSWQQVSALYERDLRRSGLFLKSAAPPPVGTPVRINLTLPTQTLIVLAGTVATHVEQGGLDGRGPGVDIKLRNVSHSAMWLIESALDAARTSGALREPEQPDEMVSDDPLDDQLLDAESELVAPLQRELDRMRKLDPFQVLGVAHDATDQDVRAAFAVLTRRFHPDRYTHHRSREAHRLAAEIFILVRNAYQHLDSPAKRSDTHGVLVRRRAAAGRSGRPAPSASDRPVPVPPPPPSPPPDQYRNGHGDGESEDPTHQIAEHPRSVGRPLSSPPEAAPAPAEPAESAESGPAQSEVARAYALLDAEQPEKARAIFKLASVRNPDDKDARIGLELAEGLVALAERDRLEAAQRFEEVLELDPDNARAARILSDMRRQASAERKNHMARLLDQK